MKSSKKWLFTCKFVRFCTCIKRLYHTKKINITKNRYKILSKSLWITKAPKRGKKYKKEKQPFSSKGLGHKEKGNPSLGQWANIMRERNTTG